MESVDYIRFISALALVLGLILALTWAMRRFGPETMRSLMTTKRRLFVVESLSLDAKHRLVLVRRDNREHLLLLGASSSVIESNDHTLDSSEVKA